MKRITIFLSSPRVNGNSDKIAAAFIKGAKDKGHFVNIVTIRDLKINGCIGCEFCYTSNGKCVQKDDMQKVYNILSETDIIVFSTPIYYQSFPSQLKAVIDRMYVSENRTFPIEGAILLATYASSGNQMAEQTVSYFKSLIQYHQWNNMGIITIDNLDGCNDIDGHEILDVANSLGYSI